MAFRVREVGGWSEKRVVALPRGAQFPGYVVEAEIRFLPDRRGVRNDWASRLSDGSYGGH